MITGISATDPNNPANIARDRVAGASRDRASAISTGAGGFFDKVRKEPEHFAQARPEAVAPKTVQVPDPFRSQEPQYNDYNTAHKEPSFGGHMDNSNVSEVAVDSFGKSPAEDKNDLWDLPPILRSKSE